MNTVETNIRDHIHGAAGVSATMTGPITITGGGLLFTADNTADIGATGATRPRNLYLAGDMKEGVVPLARMQVDEQVAGNAGSVTLTLGSAVTVASLASMDVSTGDRILVYGSAYIYKNGTVGRSSLIINKESGTAAILVRASANNADIIDSKDHDVTGYGGGLSFKPVGVVQVTTGGTLVLRLRGYSEGSSGTVDAGDGELYALVLRGT
jgi:hypothetical protein